MDHDPTHVPTASFPQAAENLTRSLLNYFGGVAAPLDHLFTLQDINLQVMMNAYEPGERALLGVALAGLVDNGDLLSMSATSYHLTTPGLERVRSVRPHVGVRRASVVSPSPQAPQPKRVPIGA